MAFARRAYERLRRRLALTLAALALLAAITGCPSRGDDDRRADREVLAALTTHDSELDALLAEVDARTKHDAPGAARLLRSRGMSLARDATRRAADARVVTVWGKRHREAMERQAQEREATVAQYAAALESGDGERLARVLRAQAELDQRALVLAAALDAPP